MKFYKSSESSVLVQDIFIPAHICIDGAKELGITFYNGIPEKIYYDNDRYMQGPDDRFVDIADSMDKEDRRVKNLMRNIMDQLYLFEHE